MNDNKNEKSFDILVDVNQLLNENPPSIYQGKTPGWRKFFKAWARRTMEQDYLETLINFRINVTAHAILKQSPLRRGQDEKIDIFLKGIAYGAEMIYGDIRQAATKEPIKSDDDK
jgi:hypothetical protein